MATAADSTEQPVAPVPLVDDLERELKFVLTSSRAELAWRWLATACQPDGQFPDADIWTVYYDTPDFDALDEKLNSDYLKMKVRLRWYAPPGESGAGAVFIEVKRRVGSRREKIRVKIDKPAETLTGRRLDDPIFASFPALLAPRGVILSSAWRPMLALRYRRRRFLEPMSHTRISVDTEIQCAGVNERYLFARSQGPLSVAVIEVKGFADALPPRLAPLLAFGARKQSMSKYAAVLLQCRRSLF